MVTRVNHTQHINPFTDKYVSVKLIVTKILMKIGKLV